MIEAGLFEFLSSVTPIRDVIAEPSLVRIYNLVVPQEGRFPCLVLQWTFDPRNQTQCGTIRIVNATVQIDSYAAQYFDAIDLASLVRLALTDFTGMWGEVAIRSCTLQTERDLEDPEPGLFRRFQAWSIVFVE